ncbi:TMEM175 family protein [Acidisarcina polymorpha]|uniref:TMEM175 family protein n=1 Tax=Acidisarcina polymorpha TaxID=2211140 RepID=UPI000DEEED41
MPDEADRKERQIGRLGSFIDAVCAIAITLLVVQLTAPKVGAGEKSRSPLCSLAARCNCLHPGFMSKRLLFSFC